MTKPKVMPGYPTIFVYIKRPSDRRFVWKGYSTKEAAKRAQKKYGIKRKRKHQ